MMVLPMRGQERINNIDSNEKELSPEQREELLRALKARFGKNMKWKELAASRMLLVVMK